MGFLRIAAAAYDWMRGGTFGRWGFRGAARERAAPDWNPPAINPNALHQSGATFLRSRARDLVLNNPHAAAGVEAYVQNVVERGIFSKPALRDQQERRKTFAKEIERWAKKEADITGHQTWYGMQALTVNEIVVGGGCLTHYVELPRRSGRRIPLAVELIPEERIVEDRDTVLTGRNPKTANPVRRGVEIDPANGRVVAYHVRPANTGSLDDADLNVDPIRLRAEDCEYAFFKRRCGQYRGHSMLNPVIWWIWKLGYYLDNELLNSALKSCFMGMLTSDEGLSLAELMGSPGRGRGLTDIVGEPVTGLRSGILLQGGPKDKLEITGPNIPGQSSEVWVRLIERGIATGIFLSFEQLCRNFSEGSFSSVLAGILCDRKSFRIFQQLMVDRSVEPTYERAVESAIKIGRPGFPTPAQYVEDPDPWLEATHHPPGWESIDKLKDVQAAVLEKDHNLGAGSDYIASKGGDIDDVLDKREYEHQGEIDRGLPQATDVESQQYDAPADEGTPNKARKKTSNPRREARNAA